MRFLFRKLSAIAFVPILLLVRLVRKIIQVELCVVGAQRFGHLALEPEVFLNLQRLKGSHSSHRVLTLWSFGRPRIHSNKKLASLWRKEVGLSPGRLVGSLIRAGELCPPLALRPVSLSIHGPHNVLDITPSRLANRTRALRSGILQQLGLKSGEFVCLVIRDGSYYAHTGVRESSGYRLFDFRADSFFEACSRLVDQGFKVVRLGTPTSNSLEVIEGVFDYANSPLRSDLNDLVLVRDCAFLLSTQTGPDALGLALRKRVLYFDVLRLSQFFFGTQLATWNPVRFVHSLTKKQLSLSEIMASEFKWLKDPDAFIQSGFSFERSSGSDIASMVSSYVEELRNGASEELLAVRRSVNRQMTEAFGERGRSTWGDVVANLNGWWLMKNRDWFLA